MIIKGRQQELIIWMGRAHGQLAGNGKAEESGHSIVDHSLADGFDLLGR
jgi:hypothetical protein